MRCDWPLHPLWSLVTAETADAEFQRQRLIDNTEGGSKRTSWKAGKKMPLAALECLAAGVGGASSCGRGGLVPSRVGYIMESVRRQLGQEGISSRPAAALGPPPFRKEISRPRNLVRPRLARWVALGPLLGQRTRSSGRRQDKCHPDSVTQTDQVCRRQGFDARRELNGCERHPGAIGPR